jgi:hypothetical protein
VGASGEGIAAPSVIAGSFVFASVAWELGDALSPEVLLAIVRLWSGTLDASPGHAGLQWTYARLEVCPIRWLERARIVLRPCARGDGGTVSATATGVPDPQSHVRPWGALGAAARAEWVPFEPLRIDLEVSLSMPLVRDEFYIAPAPVVYQAPAVVADGSLAVGVRFP